MLYNLCIMSTSELIVNCMILLLILSGPGALFVFNLFIVFALSVFVILFYILLYCFTVLLLRFEVDWDYFLWFKYFII